MCLQNYLFLSASVFRLVKVFIYFLFIFVKLREREGQRVDPGRSLKGHL